MFIVNGDLKDGLLIDGGPVPEGTAYTPIPGTDFVGGFFEVRIQRPLILIYVYMVCYVYEY